MSRVWFRLGMVLVIVLVACGTRVPEDEFLALEKGVLGTSRTVEQDGPAAPVDGSSDTDPDQVARTAPAGGDEGGEVSTEVRGGPGEGGAAEEVAESTAIQDDTSGSAGETSSGENRASDVGVTEDAIAVGNITSISGPLGENAFAPMYYGANAYFTYRNQAHGGVHGRAIEFVTCDDAEDGSRNMQCAQDLVEEEEVFALVANSTRAYAGAEYVAEQGVPDILGQPIGDEYYTYPTHYSIIGSPYPRDGVVGDDGDQYNSTVWWRFLREEFGGEVAGVFFFDSSPISRTAGLNYAEGLRREGYEVHEYPINPVTQNFSARVSQMREAGVEIIADAMDVNANRNLCRTMDDNDFQVRAKVTTSQGTSRAVREYSHPCRESVVGMGETLPYSAKEHEEVELFERVMSQVYGSQFDDRLAQWHWEGWLAARSFTQAVKKMGPEPTRDGLMEFYDGLEDYTLDGLMAPIDWQPLDFGQQKEFEDCVVASRWDEQRDDFERISPMPFCDRVPWIPWGNS